MKLLTVGLALLSVAVFAMAMRHSRRRFAGLPDD
jgi:hypothetical protein